MPSAKVLEEKKTQVSQLVSQMQNAVAGVVVDYKGINVDNDTKLRRQLREAGVDYAVVKNTLLRRAVREAGLEDLEPVFVGTTAIATSTSDPVAPAKILNEYAQKSKGAFTIKAGFIEGKVVAPAQVKDIASLPSREVLIAQALAGLNAPISGFVNVMQGNIRALATVLQAIADQKSA